MIGIELTRPAEDLSRALLARGVAAKDTQENVLRIAPPLVIDDEAIATLLAAYRDGDRIVLVRLAGLGMLAFRRASEQIEREHERQDHAVKSARSTLLL